MLKRLDEFVFQLDLTADYGVSCLRASKKQCFYFFLVGIDPMLLKHADYKEIHTILDELKFRPD